MAFYSDEPCADAGALPVWYLSQMCRSLRDHGRPFRKMAPTNFLAATPPIGPIATPAPCASCAYPVRSFAAASLTRFLPVSDDKIGLDYKITRILQGSLLPPEEAHLSWNGTFSKCGKQRS